MIEITRVDIQGWEAAVRGMRNPLNSWLKSDSYDAYLFEEEFQEDKEKGIIGPNCQWKPLEVKCGCTYRVGDNDFDLMKRLAKAGTDHRKFMRMITIYCDILAPLYWWKEFDTYKVGTVANSCSTMHMIQAKGFTLDDFSNEHMDEQSIQTLTWTIETLEANRQAYLETKDKDYWWQMIQLLPSSYNQKRTVMLNYEVLANMYKSRKNHKLDEWRIFCDWIKMLPYSEMITGEEKC